MLRFEDIKVGDALRFSSGYQGTATSFHEVTFSVTSLSTRLGQNVMNIRINDAKHSGYRHGYELFGVSFHPERFERVSKSQADLLFT